jgi:hypothetical protein
MVFDTHRSICLLRETFSGLGVTMISEDGGFTASTTSLINSVLILVLVFEFILVPCLFGILDKSK